MYNTKFTLINGRDIFPNYMDKEQRRKLKEQLGNKKQVMWCGCRNDKKLYYTLSEDLRFIPEHNGYDHDAYCFRFRNEDNKRTTAIIRSEEDTATVYLQFNPKNFTIPSGNNEEEEQDTGTDKEDPDTITESDEELNEILYVDKQKLDTSEYKEPKFNLATFVRCINHDAFTERAINNKPILSKDYFTTSLLARLKHIRVNGMKKNIRDLSIEEDCVKFFYAPFVGCNIQKTPERTSYNVIVRGYENKNYSMFTFGKIYEKALDKFHKQYGQEPDESTMIAGFQYYQKGKRNFYKVIGRMHLFQVSDHGIYCSSVQEMQNYNSIINYIRRHKDEKIRFYIPAEEEIINGIFEVEGCHKKGIVLMASTKKSKEYVMEIKTYLPLLIAPGMELTDDIIHKFIEKLKLSR